MNILKITVLTIFTDCCKDVVNNTSEKKTATSYSAVETRNVIAKWTNLITNSHNHSQPAVVNLNPLRQTNNNDDGLNMTRISRRCVRRFPTAKRRKYVDSLTVIWCTCNVASMRTKFGKEKYGKVIYLLGFSPHTHDFQIPANTKKYCYPQPFRRNFNVKL